MSAYILRRLGMFDMTEEKVFDQVVSAFLDRWLKESEQIREQIAQLEDPTYKHILAHYNPIFYKRFERLTKSGKRKALENVAIARAVTEAILTAHKLLG
jgi:hypothetical protein